VASLCRAQRRLRTENADLTRRLREAARDAADAAAAADDLRQQLELGHEWNALRHRSGDASIVRRSAGDVAARRAAWVTGPAGGALARASAPAAAIMHAGDGEPGAMEADGVWEVSRSCDVRSRGASGLVTHSLVIHTHTHAHTRTHTWSRDPRQHWRAAAQGPLDGRGHGRRIAGAAGPSPGWV
jgi:hypothetical protein